jgi:hypothetical protein
MQLSNKALLIGLSVSASEKVKDDKVGEGKIWYGPRGGWGWPGYHHPYYNPYHQPYRPYYHPYQPYYRRHRYW